MATLKAHGKELGRIETIKAKKAYFANGDVLRDQGYGWKLYCTLKPGVDPVSHFRSKQVHQAEFLANNPHYRNYRQAMLEAAPISKRWKLIVAIEMMPTDPDGVWSEVCDGFYDSLDLSLEEIANLCKLFLLAEEEARERKKDTLILP